MINILLAILSSGVLILLFKLFERLEIDSFQAITFNYYVCVLMGFIGLNADLSISSAPAQSWFPFAIVIGAFFIISFYIIAKATQVSGVTVAAVANKLSVVIPSVSAFYLYNEPTSISKIFGLILALVAVYLSSKKSGTEGNKKGTMLLPFIVWLVAGFIDTSIGYIENHYLPEDQTPLFLIWLFGIAGLLGTVWLSVKLMSGKDKFQFKNVLGGIALGVPNYGSAYFLLRSLNNSGLDKSVLFPIISIGVVLFSSISAVLFFKEKLSLINVVGLVLAAVAIVLMSL